MKTYNSINLVGLKRIEVVWDDFLDPNYSFLPKEKIKFLRIFNHVKEERVLDKNSNIEKDIEYYYFYDNSYFINPFSKQWCRHDKNDKDGSIFVVPYIKLYYENGRYETLIGMDVEIMKKTLEIIKEKIVKNNLCLINYLTGEEI